MGSQGPRRDTRTRLRRRRLRRRRRAVSSRAVVLTAASFATKARTRAVGRIEPRTPLHRPLGPPTPTPKHDTNAGATHSRHAPVWRRLAGLPIASGALGAQIYTQPRATAAHAPTTRAAASGRRPWSCATGCCGPSTEWPCGARPTHRSARGAPPATPTRGRPRSAPHLRRLRRSSRSSSSA